MAGLVIGAPAIRHDPVAAELRRWASRPFDLRRGNCGLSIAAYVARVKRLPVPAFLTAIDLRGVAALMQDGAAFVAMADRAMAALECPLTDDPQRGDAGMVRLEQTGLTACIYAGRGMWAARGDRAAGLSPGAMVRAWRVVCRRP